VQESSAGGLTRPTGIKSGSELRRLDRPSAKLDRVKSA